jgi:hypothetical protein
LAQPITGGEIPVSKLIADFTRLRKNRNPTKKHYYKDYKFIHFNINWLIAISSSVFRMFMGKL